MVTFSVFRLILCHALAGVAGCIHFLLLLSSLTYSVEHGLIIFCTYPFSSFSSLFSERACLLICLLACKFPYDVDDDIPQKKGHGGELCLSIHQGGTQVRETWLRDAFGLATIVWFTGIGVLGWDEVHGRDAVSRPGSTVVQLLHTGKGGGPMGNVWKSIGSSLMNSQATEYYQVLRSHKTRPKRCLVKPHSRIASDGTQ